jgi:TonB family protein
MHAILSMFVALVSLPGLALAECSIDPNHFVFPYSKTALSARNAFFETICSGSNGNLIDLTDPTLEGRLEKPSKPVRVGTEDVYPVQARRMGYRGKPVVAYVLEPSGLVGDVVVIESSGFDVLDRAAITSVRQWRWSNPAKLDGKPVRALIYRPVVFHLWGK